MILSRPPYEHGTSKDGETEGGRGKGLCVCVGLG